MGDILFWVGCALTLILAVDCHRKGRSSDWYWVLFFPGPLGGLAYLLYSRHAAYAGHKSWVAPWPRRSTPRVPWQKPPGPATVTPIHGRRKDKVDNKVNCSRCMRQVDKLVPFEDGRVRHYACEMCVAEIELLRKPSISFKNLEL
ncbi:MAG TPA: hypothetical protein VGO93_18615 [Candidatus Xenobia bacterium]